MRRKERRYERKKKQREGKAKISDRNGKETKTIQKEG